MNAKEERAIFKALGGKNFRGDFGFTKYGLITFNNLSYDAVDEFVDNKYPHLFTSKCMTGAQRYCIKKEYRAQIIADAEWTHSDDEKPILGRMIPLKDVYCENWIWLDGGWWQYAEPPPEPYRGDYGKE